MKNFFAENYNPKILCAKNLWLENFPIYSTWSVGVFWCVNTIRGHFDGDTLSVFCVFLLQKHSVLLLKLLLRESLPRDEPVQILFWRSMKFCIVSFLTITSSSCAWQLPMPMSLCGSSPSTRPHLPSRWEQNELLLSWEMLCC